MSLQDNVALVVILETLENCRTKYAVQSRICVVPDIFYYLFFISLILLVLTADISFCHASLGKYAYMFKSKTPWCTIISGAHQSMGIHPYKPLLNNFTNYHNSHTIFYLMGTGCNPSQWAREDAAIRNPSINMWRFQLCSPKVSFRWNSLNWAN